MAGKKSEDLLVLGCDHSRSHPSFFLLIIAIPKDIYSQIIDYYIFLTDEGYTFQPGFEEYPVETDNLQVVGFAAGHNVDDAYKNFFIECPYLHETTFEKIFCYKLDKEYERSRRDYNLNSV